MRSSGPSSLALVFVAVLGGGLLGCRGTAEPQRERESRAAAPTPAPAPVGLSPAALEAYEAAKRSVFAGDLDEARGHFTEATDAQPDFTEAWYNMGAATSRLSIAAAGAGEDQRALALFREAVSQKRRARALIDEGKWFVYTKVEEQEQVISDLQHALEEADAVMADDDSLLTALRMAAAGR